VAYGVLMKEQPGILKVREDATTFTFQKESDDEWQVVLNDNGLHGHWGAVQILRTKAKELRRAVKKLDERQAARA